MEDKDYILAASQSPAAPSAASLPNALQQFYASFKDETVGEHTMGVGGGIEDIPFGPVSVTVDNTRISVVWTKDYELSSNRYMEFIVLQGYAQITLFDRFYASCIMIGEHSPANAGGIVAIVNHLTRTQEEREKLEKQKIEEVKVHPSFYAEIYNDPINDAKHTNGVYIIVDYSQGTISCDTVFQAIGIADFADNQVFGLAVAVCANVNTFTNSMSFSVAAYVRLAEGPRFTVAGEVGILNGKLNSIGLAVKKRVPIATEIYLTQGKFNIKGFQEPKIAVSFGGGMAFGPEIKTPGGLSWVQKALYPNMKSFCPLTLSVKGSINFARNYFSLSGEGVLMGNFAVSAAVTYDDGDIKAELKAGTVRNNYLNGSLSAEFHKKRDNWSLHGNFNCSLTIDIGSFFGVAVAGGIDILLNSQNYTVSNTQFNRKDLTVSVFGMGKVKILFSINVSVNKTWVFNLSNTQLSDPNLLMKSITAGDTSVLENAQDVLVCESKDIEEIQQPLLRLSSDVIETKSWHINEQCSKSGLVKIQVAAEYTLVDSNWQLTHTDGDTVTVYTVENSAGVVRVQEFTHNYYELLLDTPEAGSWTLDILGDSENSGGIYLDALQDEKFVTQLKIVEQTDSAIKFSYSAFTGSDTDTTLVRLWAEEISNVPGYEPFSGVIAYLEETENGEYTWEIPEEFRHNANYRFYISAATSGAGSLTESNGVEVFLARLDADLECSWELAYDANNANIVTAYITVTNTGKESCKFQWEILDYTNNDSVDADDDHYGNTYDVAEVIASGRGLEIKGNSSMTFEQVITVTDELRDNPSSLLLSVTQENPAAENEEDETYADDSDEITFSAVNSDNCQKQTITWQAVDGAVSYILQYALEGDWETGGVYVNNISGTSYLLSVAPGEYAYRVIAIGSDGKAIGTWSEEQEIDVLFHDKQTIHIDGNTSSARTQLFELNDGIYDLNSIDVQNFTGTLTLFRSDWVKTGENEDGVTLIQTDNDILTLAIVNGVLKNPVSEILLDHGDYFWEWSQAEDGNASSFDITLELSGEVFSVEQQDREIISIGDDTNEMPLVGEAYVETLEGEVGFSNKDAIYQYLTDDGGELSITIKSGTVFESDVDLFICIQNSSDGEFDCVKTVTVKGGEYTADTVLIDRLLIKNNFYVQVASPDDGKGKYNTEYCFGLSFDTFEDSVQTEDILTVNGESIKDWIGYRNEEHRYLLQIKSDDRYAVRLNGDAHDAILKVCEVNGAVIEEKHIGVNGTSYIDDIYLKSGNYFVSVNSADKGEGQFNTDYVLRAYELKTLYPLIDNSDDTLDLAFAKNSFAFNTSIENWLGTGDKADFFKFSLAPESPQTSSLILTVDAKTAQAVKDGLLEINCTDRFGQELELKALSESAWEIDPGIVFGDIYVGIQRDSTVEEMAYSFNVSNVIVPGNLSGSQEGISWDIVPGASKYIVEYSQDNFENVLCLETASNKIDFFDLPAGIWQWRVKAFGSVASDSEQIITSGNITVQKLVSEANGNTDMFFANANGKWEAGYAAQHAGILNSWSGTNERVHLTGKNKLADIFEGSTDANILLMTDDANGDALFVDDMYTALPGTVAEQQARIAQIYEIRSGAGDDIVDMTSQHFAYVGDGVKVYGGLGNDTIWANNGNNTLFGDAGNDRLVGGSGNDVIIGGIGNDSMHGGGGDDIFCFGENWGKDTVEQLAGGEIILWFGAGSESNWNADTLTYTDGENRVTVSGVANVTLRFDTDASLPAECFDDAASEKIFEDKNKGFLA